MKTFKELKDISYLEMFEKLKKCKKKIRKQKDRIKDLNNQLDNAISNESIECIEDLAIATLNAVQSMNGGKIKADLRDAYDKATDFLRKLDDIRKHKNKIEGIKHGH
jgi:predicted phage-related endonuclease